MIYKINGIQINYYFICKTKLWLFSHNINMEHESDSVAIGKILHENSYKREKEFMIDNMINIDFIKKRNPLEIHEVKKTKKMEKAHKFQLLYYMYYLKKYKNIENTVGYLDYPTIKEEIKVKLTKENEKEIEKIIEDIHIIINSDIPKPKMSKICRKCAYFEFCFA